MCLVYIDLMYIFRLCDSDDSVIVLAVTLDRPMC